MGVVMDPIARIHYAKDSTLAMLLAAAARGFEIDYFEQGDLTLRDGRAFGRARALTVKADPAAWFALGEPRVEPLGALDCILMRKDPPFDTEYIYTTYILERAEAEGALVVNRPQGLRDMNEKVYTAWFAQCCAPTLVTRDTADMRAFLREHGKIVVKPLHGMGGKSIFVVERGDKNTNVVFETLTGDGRCFAIAQRYIPEIAEPVPYALARIPSADDNRGNLAAGARGVARPLNDRDRWLAGEIGPALAARGMLFVGLDVIGGYVTEINVTSPTGIREIDAQCGTRIGDSLLAAIERRLQARPPARGREEGAPRAGSGITPMASRALTLREGSAPVRDRLIMTLFVAALLHGIIILGITFSGKRGTGGAAPGLEVLLVSDQLPAARRNDTAAYLAQRTQIGSGNTDRAVSPRNRAAARALPGHEGVPAGTSLAGTGSGGAGTEPIVTTSAPLLEVRYVSAADTGAAPGALPLEIPDRPGETAAPAAGVGPVELRGPHRNDPWVTPDTRAAILAPYLARWRARIERIGTLNFPAAARHAGARANPVIEVEIRSDGKLEATRVVRSSGHPDLDHAALEILALASPFDPFPPQLARKYRVLRFTYEWEFVGGRVGHGALSAVP
jgi:glutathione synthase